MQSIKSIPVFVVLSLLAGAVVFMTMRADRGALVVNYRSLVIWITAIGFMMCSVGAIGYFMTRSPFHPLTMLSMLMGSFALIVGVMAALGKDFMFVRSPAMAIYVVGAVIVVKFIIARVHTLLIS